MTIDEFIQRELNATGKRLFTVAEVVALTEKFIAEKKAAAAPFTGWTEQERPTAPAATEGGR